MGPLYVPGGLLSKSCTFGLGSPCLRLEHRQVYEELAGAHVRDVLITAGATRNPLDSMRFISAHSSGRTGTSIATALLSAGANVTILGSPEATLRAPTASTTELFASTRDLMEKMQLWLEDHPNALVIHAAAVGDYEAKPQIGKIPSGSSELVLHLQPTPKILDQIRDWAPGCFLVSFKAAAPATTLDALNEIASAQLKRSNSDLVFGNIIGALSEAVILVSSDKSRNFPSREAGMNALLRHAIQALRG